MIIKIYNMLVVGLLAIVLLAACNEGEENIDWKAGDTLIIQGSSQVSAGTEEEPYYVEGFTINKSYTWALNGSPIEASGEGQYVYLDFPATGTYTLTVSDGAYEGEITVTAADEM